MSKLLVLVGHKGAGKDASITLLPHTNVKMAGALKQMLRFGLESLGFNQVVIDRMVEGDLKEDPAYGINRSRFKDRSVLFEMLLGLVEYQVGGEDKAWQILSDFEHQPCEFLCGMSTLDARTSLAKDWLPHLKALSAQNTPRWLMQSLGTEWGRKGVHPDIWTNIVKRRVEMLQSKGIPVVITDARFSNEVDMLRSIGGKVVRIDRPGLAIDLSHESEAHIHRLAVDHVIINDGTIEELRTKLHTI